MKSRSFHDKDKENIDDKYAPFDFNKLGIRQRAGTLQPKGVQFKFDKNGSMSSGNSLHSNKLRANTLRTNKAVKFSRPKSGKDSKGISFRKSHNNLPIMHPKEIEAIHNSKKKKKNLYKQRASYSAAHFSRNKNQLLTQYNNSNKSSYNHHNIYSKKKMHDKDEEFLNSLIEPVKKRELNEAIEKLKQVIESSSLTNLIGSTIEMSLREVLRKLQLLRLDVTLREYRKSWTK